MTTVQLRDFLETHFEIISLDLAVAETAVRLRRGHHMRLPDAVIWATAQTNNPVLVSRNTKDFNPDWDGIRVPYKKLIRTLRVCADEED